MRSQVVFRKGEIRGCLGCHENRRSAPPANHQFISAKPENLRPLPGPDAANGLSFAKTVQPVLDKYCISCHGLNGNAGNLNLIGTPTEYFNNAYEQLVLREGFVSLAKRKQETNSSEPKDYGSHAGKLALFLLTEHKKYVNISPPDFERLVTWLDINAPYYGDYKFIKQERCKLSEEGIAQLKKYLKQLNYSPLGDIDNTPAAALINTAAPLESRALNLPLAEMAGGWAKSNWLWQTKNDADYLKTLSLITNALENKMPEPLNKSAYDAFVY